MKIQISKDKRIKDIPAIWYTAEDDVDIITNPTAPESFIFNTGKLKTIYCFGALGYCHPKNIEKTIMQWLRALKSGGSIFIVELDFERTVREFVGADITLDEFNENYNRISHIVKEDLAKKIQNIGVPFENIKQWSNHKEFKIHSPEFILEIIKP